MISPGLASKHWENQGVDDDFIEPLTFVRTVSVHPGIKVKVKVSFSPRARQFIGIPSSFHTLNLYCFLISTGISYRKFCGKINQCSIKLNSKSVAWPELLEITIHMSECTRHSDTRVSEVRWPFHKFLIKFGLNLLLIQGKPSTQHIIIILRNAQLKYKWYPTLDWTLQQTTARVEILSWP